MNNTNAADTGSVLLQHFLYPRQLGVMLLQTSAPHKTPLLSEYLLKEAERLKFCLPPLLSCISLLRGKIKLQTIITVLRCSNSDLTDATYLPESTQVKLAKPDCKVTQHIEVTHLHFLYSLNRCIKDTFYLFMLNIREPS